VLNALAEARGTTSAQDIKKKASSVWSFPYFLIQMGY
jgi:hypothetical protein